MKTLSIIILLVGFWGFQASAQTANQKSNFPYQTISKEVQKIQFKNVEHMPAKIVLTNASAFSSKGSAQILARNTSTAERAMVRTGYPSWSISKGVARQQFEKNRK